MLCKVNTVIRISIVLNNWDSSDITFQFGWDIIDNFIAYKNVGSFDDGAITYAYTLKAYIGTRVDGTVFLVLLFFFLKLKFSFLFSFLASSLVSIIYLQGWVVDSLRELRHQMQVGVNFVNKVCLNDILVNVRFATFGVSFKFEDFWRLKMGKLRSWIEGINQK